MDKTLSTLLWIGAILFAFWFLFIRKANGAPAYNLPVFNPDSAEPVVRPIADTSIASPTNTITVTKTFAGFRRVCLPVDNLGNIVEYRLATRVVCLDNIHDDCQVNYGNRVYFIRFRNWPPPPPPPEPAPAP